MSDTALLGLAINAGQQQLQMDGNFRCMEKHIARIYTTSATIYGVAMPSAFAAGSPNVYACKQIRNVWNTTGATTDGATITGTPIATSPIIPATEDDVNSIRNIAKQTRGLASATGNQQRWYEKEQNACLMLAPAANTVLMVDYYGFLPNYSADSDNDYFSNNLWLCLLFASAWVGSISFWEDTRRDFFEAGYRTQLQQAIAMDKGFKLGGVPVKPPGDAMPAPVPAAPVPPE